MKTYVAVTGVVFAILTIVHLWRMVEEPHLVKEPFFLGVTLVSAILAVWSWRSARR